VPAGSRAIVNTQTVGPLQRRVAAAVALAALVAVVVSDVWIPSMRSWWERHSVTGSIVSSLLVLAVTVLVIDEVVARRGRNERARVVAVQGLIVYGQIRRSHDAILAQGSDGTGSDAAVDELRNVANMLLIAAPMLFDDPTARAFLEEAQRFSAMMIRIAVARTGTALTDQDRDRLAAGAGRLQTAVAPLIARLPKPDAAFLEGGDEQP
jgi:hypothetical protein